MGTWRGAEEIVTAQGERLLMGKNGGIKDGFC